MHLKLKLGLALVTAFALSAMAASAAQAEYNLTPEKNFATITANQIAHEAGNKFEITSTGAKTECANATYEGVSEGLNVTDLTVHPTYTGCTVADLVATADTKGCDFTLTGETSGTDGIVHIICETGKFIKVNIPAISCAIKIHEQTPTEGGVRYENGFGASPDDVIATATVKGITYEREGVGTLCKLAIPSEGNDMDFLQKLTVRAYEGSVTKTGTLTEEKWSFTEGNQINLTVS